MEKQNIILLHGALGSRDQLKPLKNLLSTQFNVYDLNFEGHGDKPSDQNFSIELFSNNLHELLQKLNIKKTHLFGYSMGGYVALHFTLNHPNYVKSIMTLGTKFDWTKETAAKEVKMLDPVKIEEKVPAFAQYQKNLHTAQSWKSVMKKTAKMMIALGNGNRLKEKDLTRINQHVIIGIGESDNMVSLEESKHAANTLAKGELKILSGCKHPIEKVNLEELSNILFALINDKILN